MTNSRPGIKIYKTDWVGTRFLSGAVFTLKDSEGADVAAKTYTSGADGLVTIAYLGKGTYILNEIQTPSGYAALDLPITIKVDEDGQITVSGEEGFYEFYPADESEMAKVIVKNRTVEELIVKKVDENKQPLKDVHFALYRQVTDNNGIPRKDYLPISGYEDIETDENGVLPNITMDIGTGTYYLTETHTVSGYKKLSDDLCFTIGKDGTVSIDTEKYASWLTRTDTGSGSVSYSIIIPNSPLGITVRKTDSEGVPLTGSQFTLTELNESECWVAVGDYGLDQGLIDLTKKTEITFTGMSNGRYCLKETKAPDGYIQHPRSSPSEYRRSGNTTIQDPWIDSDRRDWSSALEKKETLPVRNTAILDKPLRYGAAYLIVNLYEFNGVITVPRRRIPISAYFILKVVREFDVILQDCFHSVKK